MAPNNDKSSPRTAAASDSCCPGIKGTSVDENNNRARKYWLRVPRATFVPASFLDNQDGLPSFPSFNESVETLAMEVAEVCKRYKGAVDNRQLYVKYMDRIDIQLARQHISHTDKVLLTLAKTELRENFHPKARNNDSSEGGN